MKPDDELTEDEAMATCAMMASLLSGDEELAREIAESPEVQSAHAKMMRGRVWS